MRQSVTNDVGDIRPIAYSHAPSIEFVKLREYWTIYLNRTVHDSGLLPWNSHIDANTRNENHDVCICTVTSHKYLESGKYRYASDRFAELVT